MITSQQRTKLQLILAVAVLAIITLVLFNSTHSQSARAEQNTTSSASSTMGMASTTTSTTGTSTTMNMGMGTSSGTTPTTMGMDGVTGSSTSTSTMSTSTQSSGTTTSSSTMPMTYHITIMKHLCSNITSLPDFLSLEAGKGPIAALASTVLNCPTTGLLGNEAMAGTVSSPRTNYSFQVMNGTTTKTLTDGTFMSHKICESNVNLDVNMDGTISSSTCLDISDYDIPLTHAGSSTIITVTENMQPTGFHFGTIRFTPPTLIPNNDAQNLVSLNASSSTITLDMKNDTDGMVMLHFGREEHVSIMMNGAKVGDAFTNSTGSFSTGSMSVPSALGSKMYHFMGQTSGITGYTTITVIP